MFSVEIFVVDYDLKLHKIKLTSRRARKYNSNYDNLPAINSLQIESNGIDVHFFLKEITQWNTFRRCLLGFLFQKQCSLCIKIVPPNKEPLDYRGNQITSQTMWEKVEIDNMMSWLSTLGGGFSALGDSFINCAEIAQKISLKQLALGIRLNDPFIQARCKLFYSISLIQMGRLRLAKYIIRQQYQFALQYLEYDARLARMCQGIWLKLQYEYKMGRHRRKLLYNTRLKT